MVEQKVFINLSTLRDIAHAVKVQLGETAPEMIKVTELADIISNIATTSSNVSDTTATVQHVLKEAIFYQADGVKTYGGIETYAEEYLVGDDAEVQHGSGCRNIDSYTTYSGDYEEIYN